MLRKVQDKWIGGELTGKQYKEAKDAYILGRVEDVQAVLEDSLAMMATISSSRFVAGLLCFATHSCCSKKRSVCAIRHHHGRFYTQKQPEAAALKAATRKVTLWGLSPVPTIRLILGLLCK